MKTSEHTFIGHPDKVCDQIADAILDAYLEQDPYARVAIETMGGHGQLHLTGEITSKARVDHTKIAYEIYHDIYDRDIVVSENIVNQSPDISQGVDAGGAGDQGVCIGYATNETPEMIPLEHAIVKRISMRAEELGLGPDGKCQVTLNEIGEITDIVVSVQGETDKREVWNKLVQPIAEEYTLCVGFGTKDFFFNPTGKFEVGGFDSDAGCTGRKIVIDAYGAEIPVGGGAFSGKDPTKVDRSGAYMARRIAVDYLRWYRKEGFEPRACLVKLAYVIGIAEPVMAIARTFSAESSEYIDVKIEKDNYDLRPQAIIERLDLRQPQYFETARFGSFGRGFKWEK